MVVEVPESVVEGAEDVGEGLADAEEVQEAAEGLGGGIAEVEVVRSAVAAPVLALDLAASVAEAAAARGHGAGQDEYESAEDPGDRQGEVEMSERGSEA